MSKTLLAPVSESLGLFFFTMNQQLITRINGADIISVDRDGEVFVPIKPICQALGIDPEGQRQRIDRHYILKSVAFTLKATGADGKSYDMLCLPLEFTYGWLFTIDANLVADDRREAVAKYQRECYDVLYEHFTCEARRTVETNKIEISLLEAINEAISREKTAKADRRKAEESLAKLRADRLNVDPQLPFC